MVRGGVTETQVSVQALISALLNVFQSEFQVNDDQRLEVLISVPWHRYSNENINLPQKLKQYVKYLQWDKSGLRRFMCRRIEWEFSRVKRNYTLKGKDAWSILFDDYVFNDYCVPNINEDSFEYLLRHTNYRPREVQRIARMAVEVCAKKAGRSVDEVLKGISGLTVNGHHLKEAVYDYAKEATEDLKSEASRRYPNLPDVFQYTKGLPVPFVCDDLAKRLPKDIVATEAFSILWESGFLGVEVSCAKREYERDFTSLLPNHNHKVNRNFKSEQLNRWYFFEYNSNSEVTELIEQYRANQKLSVQCVIHPRTFESIGAHVKNNWPYGI